MRRAVQLHAGGVEEPGGLFDEIAAVAPRLARRSEALREDHVAFAARADTLAGKLAARDDRDMLGLRREAAARLADLRAHRGAEADLVYEAFWTELGAGD